MNCRPIARAMAVGRLISFFASLKSICVPHQKLLSTLKAIITYLRMPPILSGLRITWTSTSSCSATGDFDDPEFGVSVAFNVVTPKNLPVIVTLASWMTPKVSLTGDMDLQICAKVGEGLPDETSAKFSSSIANLIFTKRVSTLYEWQHYIINGL